MEGDRWSCTPRVCAAGLPMLVNKPFHVLIYTIFRLGLGRIFSMKSAFSAYKHEAIDYEWVTAIPPIRFNMLVRNLFMSSFYGSTIHEVRQPNEVLPFPVLGPRCRKARCLNGVAWRVYFRFGVLLNNSRGAAGLRAVCVLCMGYRFWLSFLIFSMHRC